MTAADDPIERTAYVETFFKELSPTWLNYVVALHGLRPCALDRPFAYAELGCGFGQTIATNAAAFPNARFLACDINPLHVEAARRYAAALALGNLEVHGASFDELARRDLPPLDFVVLHGVYSWIGEDARKAVCSFIRRHLKPGGIAYVSYNSLPGWSVEIPLRRLFRELATTDGDDVNGALARGLRSLNALADAKLAFFTTHPAMREVAKSFATRAPGYMAHEYLGEHWSASYSVDVADDLRDADLHYVGSATLADNHPALTTGDDASAAIAVLPTARQRRLADDFATNRSFRRDVFVRGASAPSSASHLNEIVVGRLRSAESLEARVRVPRGIVTFQDAFVDELRLLLAQGSSTIGDIVDRLQDRASNASEVVRNLTILLAAGELMPFARVHASDARAGAPGRLDDAVRAALAYAVEHRVPRALPSRTLGNGVEVQPLEALALSERLAGAEDVDTLTRRIAEREHDPAHATADALHVDDSARGAATNVMESLWPMLQRLGMWAPV